MERKEGSQNRPGKSDGEQITTGSLKNGLVYLASIPGFQIRQFAPCEPGSQGCYQKDPGEMEIDREGHENVDNQHAE